MNDRPAARPNPAPNPNEKLVRVFDTEQESEALVVHGLLESTGIDSDITSLDAQQDILPGVGGTIILVREEDAGEAKRVIEEYRRAPGSDETAEIDISGIPPKTLLKYFPRLEEIAHKTLFGTDWPGPGVPDIKQNLDDFKALPLSEEIKRQILSKTALSIWPE